MRTSGWRGALRQAEAMVIIGSVGASGVLASGEETPAPSSDTARSINLTLEVDATDLARNLLQASMTMPVSPGPMDLHFVLWTPGNHAPSGPIQNLVDLHILDDRGRALEWRRDPARATRFSIDVPEGCRKLRIDLGYIASQPSTISGSTDSYGGPSFGGVNWNTVLLYPAGYSHQEVQVRAALAMPSAWRFATPLAPSEEHPQGGVRMRRVSGAQWIDFAPVSLAELVDSPVIMGEYLRSYRLDVEGVAPHWMHLVADEPIHAELPDWLKLKFEEMVRQSIAIFARPGEQSFPRNQYHFLWLLGEKLNFGVEHATCTYMGDAADLVASAEETPTKGGGGTMGVVPHEYFHAWCAKLRAPAGLIMPDYHTPPTTDLLWVYEGLTTYYTNVLSVRSGLITEEEYQDRIRDSLVRYQQRSGRLWRPVVDSARAAGPLRGRSLYWTNRRQGQEYYGQGALFWLEADALIRLGTKGERSLDDFCRLLFDVPARPVGAQSTFTRRDVVDTLTKVHDAVDWDALIASRLERPQQSLDLSHVTALLGRVLEFTDEPTDAQRKARAKSEATDLSTSLGIVVNKENLIRDIIPGSPGDRAKLAFGMEILAVDGRSFTHEHLREAIDATPLTGRIALTVQFGQRVQTIEIDFNGGPRFPRLEARDGQPDILEAIARPREFAPARP